MSYGGFSHGTNRTTIEQALRDLKPVRISGNNLTAVADRVLFHGELPAEHVAQYRADRPVYTVLSYETPIAWVAADGTIRIPDVKYSRTTTQHQYTCKFHLGQG